MVVAQITGGLGNQLFQYAAAKALSLHHNVPLLFDISMFYRDELPELEVPRNFELYHFKGIDEQVIPVGEITSVFGAEKNNLFLRKVIPAFKKKIYTEPHYHYDKNFFKSRKQVFLKGGWQSEKYFKPYEGEIRKNVQLKSKLYQNVKEIGNSLRAQNSVAVHIRRGDYLRKPIILEWHGVMTREYYARAFELLQSKTNNLAVYYFTDDPGWVADNLLPLLKGEILSGVYAKSHYEDLYLMTQCKHNIIANSSFSWWAAWLNDNPEKIVIAPTKWFDQGYQDTQDILPENWLKV